MIISLSYVNNLAGNRLVSALTLEQFQIVEHQINIHKNLPGALLPMLHAIQDSVGFVPEDCYESISKALALSVAEVHGVVTFYHHFRTHPVGKHVLQICRAESCQAMGSEQLEAKIKSTLGVEYHETTADGAITLTPVYCLGNCACSPAVMMDDELYGRVNYQKLVELIRQARTGV